MEDANLTELRKEFQEKKKQILVLRSQLNTAHAEKETSYQALAGIRGNIRSFTEQLQKTKQERDSLTEGVKALKTERDSLNKGVKEAASRRKEAEQKKEGKKPGETANPAALRAEISRLERRLETEVMPFSREQQLTKQIKVLKAKCKDLEQLEEVWKEATTAQTTLSERRRVAQHVHQELQGKAQQSQEKHEQVTTVVQKLKRLREEEKNAGDAYGALKKKYTTLKEEFEQVQRRVNELGKLFTEESEKNLRSKIYERTADVQEKIRKGKKLSTEDILAFQALED